MRNENYVLTATETECTHQQRYLFHCFTRLTSLKSPCPKGFASKLGWAILHVNTSTAILKQPTSCSNMGYISTQRSPITSLKKSKTSYRCSTVTKIEYLTVDNLTFGRLTHEQKMRKLSEYLMAGMDGKEDVLLKGTANQTETPSTSASSITARESGITTVPIAILEALFDKAATLVSTPGSVVPKPGASDGYFMVAGVSNKVHSVTPGKGGSSSCDNNCINRSTKI